MDSFRSSNCNKADTQDKASNNVEVISVFDQDSSNTLQQILEDSFIQRLNSYIDNSPATRYTNINSR